MINARTLDRIESSMAIEIPLPKDPTQTKTRHVAFKLKADTVYKMDQPLFDRLSKLGVVEPSDQPGIPIELIR